MASGTKTQFSGEAVACARGARLVFRSLDFALAEGGALVLVGANGSGKSSLLRLMAGLSAPVAGRITWDGTAITEDRQTHAARLHYIGHATGAKPALKTAEDLAFWSAFHLQDDADAQTRALDHFGLSRRADFPIGFLSSGQKRRLALARLIAAPAPLWLLDEPTVGLDKDGQAALESAIAEHRAGGGILVVASHTPIDLGAAAAELDLGDYANISSADLDEDGLDLALGTGA
ncbi:MAG: heme ABC exporter ATP-binding protein CcmA [Alphaproteobacteria bacterium]|nr:heme ABC exporter ATP-binding protein CcmA [Alphaproteobacteria bacterium]